VATPKVNPRRYSKGRRSGFLASPARPRCPSPSPNTVARGHSSVKNPGRPGMLSPGFPHGFFGYPLATRVFPPRTHPMPRGPFGTHGPCPPGRRVTSLKIPGGPRRPGRRIPGGRCVPVPGLGRGWSPRPRHRNLCRLGPRGDPVSPDSCPAFVPIPVLRGPLVCLPRTAPDHQPPHPDVKAVTKSSKAPHPFELCFFSGNPFFPSTARCKQLRVEAIRRETERLGFGHPGKSPMRPMVARPPVKENAKNFLKPSMPEARRGVGAPLVCK